MPFEMLPGLCSLSIPIYSSSMSGERSTFFRQASFDLISAVEILGMIWVGRSSRLFRSDPDYRRAFRPLALASLGAFAAGLTLKVAYYATCHLWSDLILARATRVCGRTWDCCSYGRDDQRDDVEADTEMQNL